MVRFRASLVSWMILGGVLLVLSGCQQPEAQRETLPTPAPTQVETTAERQASPEPSRWAYFPNQGIYYDRINGQYWVMDRDGVWVKRNDVSVPTGAPWVAVRGGARPYLYQSPGELLAPKAQQSLPAGFPRTPEEGEPQAPPPVPGR